MSARNWSISTLTRLTALPLASALALAACAPAPDDAATPVVAAPAPVVADVLPSAPSTPPPAPLDEATTAAIPDELASFACVGGEPAWTLALSPDGAALHVDDRDHALAGELRQTSTGAWTWLSAVDPETEGSYALLLSPSACFPGEGQPAQPYIAELSLPDGRRASGCCEPAASR